MQLYAICGSGIAIRIPQNKGFYQKGEAEALIYGFSHESKPARTKSSSFKWGYAR